MKIRLFAMVVMVTLLSSSAFAFEPRHVFLTNRGGNNIVELDENFVFQRTWFQGIEYEGVTLNVQNGMAFTPDDELFVADSGNNRIVAFDSTGVFVRAFSTLDKLGPGVESIYFDGSGTMFASANPGLGVVARYQRDGTESANVVMDDQFLNLSNVNLTDAGNVLVADFSDLNRGLRELDPTSGDVIRTFGTDLGRQEDVMIDGADRVFVSHYAGNEVVVYGPAPERAELYRFTAPGEPMLILPSGIALTQDCQILVASYDNGSIFIFEHQGGSTAPTFVRVLQPGAEIPESAALSLTESIAVSGLGLPGGSAEFADTVPSCDPIVIMDAGPRPDVGTDAGAIRDAAAAADSSAVDAKADGGSEISGGGCGCNVAAQTRTPLMALGIFVALWWRRMRRYLASE